MQANIRALMGSDVAITDLMDSLDQAVREIADMETKLDVYDQLLGGVRDMMSKMGARYAAILLENSNLSSLHREVDELVVRGGGRGEGDQYGGREGRGGNQYGGNYELVVRGGEGGGRPVWRSL